MQLFAKFKKILRRGFRATLNFRKFNVEGQTFVAHRCVLATSGKFSFTLFTNDMEEKSALIVSLEGIPVMVMDQLLSYLYTGEIKVPRASVSCEVYDTTLNEWHSIASMHVPRFHASAVLLRDQNYVFGRIGSESVDRHNSRMVECYDVQKNQWAAAHSMPYEETYFRGCPVSVFRDLLHSLNKVTIP